MRRALAIAIAVLGLTPGLAAAAPANDHRADAQTIAAPSTVVLDTRGATAESGENLTACAPHGATVWFVLDAPQATTIVSTEGSSFDTVLATFSADGALLACSDDAIGSASEVAIAAGPGTVYIQAGGWAGSAGTLRLRAERAGRIVGTVTADGAPVHEICVEALTASHPPVRGVSDTDGTFAIGPLMPDTYRLRLVECVRRQRFAESWHGGSSFDEATPVVVAAAAEASASIVARSIAPGTISGRIREPNGAGLQVCVTAYWLPAWYRDEGPVAARVWTDETGRYTLTLEPEAYKLLIDDRCGLDTIDAEREVVGGPPIWPGWWTDEHGSWGRTGLYDATPIRLQSSTAIIADATIAPVRTYPDLALTEIDGIEADQPGGPQGVRVSMINAGSDRSSAATLYATICLNDHWSSCRDRYGSVPSLDPGASHVVELTWDGQIHVGRVRLTASAWAQGDLVWQNNRVEGSATFTADVPVPARVCVPDPCLYG